MTTIPPNTSYRALIIDTQTDEGRWSEHPYPWGEGSLFCWTEYNFHCDCNRHDFFMEAGDREGDEDFPCGHDRYRVPYVELIPGKERIEVDGEDDE